MPFRHWWCAFADQTLHFHREPLLPATAVNIWPEVLSRPVPEMLIFNFPASLLGLAPLIGLYLGER